MSADIGPSPFKFGPWVATSSKGPILDAVGLESLEKELEMKSMPDMIFAQNTIKLRNEQNGFEIEFNARDALRLCDKEKCPNILVKAAENWESGSSMSFLSLKSLLEPRKSKIFERRDLRRDSTIGLTRPRIAVR